MDTSPVIEAKNVVRIFGTGQSARRALGGIDLRIERGEFVALIGPSGSGKTTLLSIVGTLDLDFTGTLLLFGTSCTKLSDRKLSRLRGSRLGFVFQAFHLIDQLSLFDNVLVPSLFISRGEPQREAMEALKRVGLGDRAFDLACTLSGGQRQRVAIARAIAHKPQLLLCDEPTGNLDKHTARQTIDIFASLNQVDGTTVVCATHDTRIAEIATRSVHLRDGKLTDKDRA